jgi:flavin reductase (DIM6/NTAB) family NADH-FMN oxidoreductase RutF
MVSLDASALSPQEIYRLLISTIIPRPIALISTCSSDGSQNLAPFSFFNGVSSNPATVMVSIAVRPDGGIKDTLRNILETREFVVNSANQWLIEPLVHTAGAFDYGVDEMKEAGLTGIASDVVRPLRVRESAAQFECTLYDSMKIGDGSAGSSTIVIGEIKKFHLAESVYQNGRVDQKTFQAVGRLGGISYTNLEREFEIPIPQISDK